MSKWLFPAVWVLGASINASAQQPPSPDLLLARVRNRMILNLERLPDYTCLQTIERRVRHASSKRIELIDIVRLEVALVHGKEMFAWPGAGNFEDKEISQIVTGGAIGNGSFALHAKSIFQSQAASITFIGEVIRNNHGLLKWDYEVPQPRSGYILRVGSREAIVGYHGSFWADPASFDLVRLEVEADNIPPELHIARARDSVEYMRADIGTQTFLLPQSAELAMVDENNSESINQTSFTKCRQYTGESVLLFHDPAPGTPTPVPVTNTFEVPAGLSLELELDSPIASGTSAVGDPITAVLQKPLKQSGKVFAPKGAFVHGRITNLRHENLDRGMYVVGLEFFALEFPGTRATLRARLQQVVSPAVSFPGPNSSRYEPNIRMNPAASQSQLDLPGSVFFVRGDSLKLPRGFHMFWLTQSPTEEK